MYIEKGVVQLIDQAARSEDEAAKPLTQAELYRKMATTPQQVKSSTHHTRMQSQDSSIYQREGDNQDLQATGVP